MTTVLDARIRELGWEFGQFRHAYAETGHRLGYRNVSLGPKTFYRWRAGGQLPRPHARHILTEMFSLPVERLLAQAQEADDAAGEVYRREVLRTALAAASLGVAGPTIAALEAARRAVDDALGSTRVSPITLERWERAADEYAAAYQITPPHMLLPDVVADFEEVGRLLAAPQPVKVRVGLSRAAHRLALLAAVFLSAMGEHREARGWLHTALLAADESGDPLLIGQTMARSAIVSLYYGSPVTALVDAQRAAEVLGDQVCPAAARAWVVKARAHARLGHEDQALASLERAAHVHCGLTPDQTGDTAFGYTHRQFGWHCANALVHLGRVDEATDLQKQALAAYRPSERLDPALIRLDGAVGMLRGDDPSAAADAAAQVWVDLPAPHRTGIVLSYIKDMLGMVSPAASTLPAVAQLRELTTGAAA